MSDLNLQTFNKLYPMIIHPYEQLFTDQNASVPDKINQIVTYLNQVGKLTNDVVRDWNTVYQWVMGDGLTTDVNNKLETMLANHEFDPIMNTILTKIGDLTQLQTVDKDTLVHAINDNVASLAQITSQNNHTITYGYDANGNVQTVTEKDSSNNVVQTVTYTYNVSGDVATSVTVANGKTTTTTYNYDVNGNITSTSNVLS